MRFSATVVALLLVVTPIGAQAPPAPARTQATMAQAAGQALVDAGTTVVTCVPATGAVSIYEAWRTCAKREQPYQYHEEVALGMAMGASLTGQRSAVIVKSHGLAKAANALIDAWTLGTEGGLLILVAADKEGHSSDSIFDPDAFVAGTRVPFQRLGPEEIHGGILAAYARSEAVGLPVVLLVEDDDLVKAVAAPPPSTAPARTGAAPKRDPLRHVLFPMNTHYPHQVVQAKLAGRDWRTIPRPTLPSIPEGVPPKFQAGVRSYMPVFDIFKGLREEVDFIMGDTSTSTLFTCPPYDLLDAATYYGGSIPMAVGAIQAGARKVWALTGDWAFTAAGHLGLHEAFHLGIPVKVLLFHNHVALATGGQPMDEALFERLLKVYSEFLRRANVSDPAALRSTLRAAQESNRMEIVVVDFP